MAKKEFRFYGKTLEELKKMRTSELTELLPSRQRRSLKRGMTDEQNKLYDKVEEGAKDIKTHARDAIILPKMIGKIIRLHNGKTFEALTIEPEMVGHRLGEFVFTRKRVGHSSPGVGATKSSGSVSVK